MNPAQIIINDVGRLRSGWRLLLFVFLFYAASLLLVTVLRIGYAALHAAIPTPPYAQSIFELTYRFMLIVAALGAGYVLAKTVEGLPFRSLGLTTHDGWLRDLLFGCAAGFAALVLAVAIAAVAGRLRFTLSAAELIPSMVKSLIGSGLLLFVAALAEEAMFRGYPLQTLARAGLAWLGVILTLALFGLVHLENPNVVPLTFINTALAGLGFAVAYLRTRSLWLPLGLHWSWNWALGWFFGLPISGIKLVSHPLLTASDGGPFWLTGGSYGIEGGVACTVSFSLLTLFIWRTSWLKATPELKKLTSQENPATPSPVISTRPAEE
jgi:membrane protease YdiL (CAAX protease family)